MPQQTGDLEGQEAFPLLDAYTEELHAGRQPEREPLLQQSPHLASVLDCLDALDSLAPPATILGHEPLGILQTETVAWPTAEPGSLPAASAATVTCFGDYELLGEIGRGGMGVVYKARQVSLDRVVAIKMILANHLASDDEVRRFHVEAKAAAKLHHPHIIGIHEVGQIHGQPYFAMDYVAGSSLAEQLRNGPLEPEAAALCLCAVARAVDHLHSQGIVHRDLKPSNILLDEKGQPVVTDFGLAKMFAGDSHMTHTGAIVGTPSYMAPEQAAGRGSDVGPASDVYSLGAILYELLTGRPPFREEMPLDTLVQVLEGEPPPPSQLNRRVPRELELITLRCLEKAPEQRYPSAAALADDLEGFLKGDVIIARSPGPWQKVRRWTRRKPALAARLVLLGICFGIELVNYALGMVPLAYVEQISGILAIWALLSFGFQSLLTAECWSETARFAWGAADAVLTTAALLSAGSIEGPLLVVYPALIVASGLWFRARLVWFATAMALVSYLGGRALHSSLLDTPLREPLYRSVIFVVVLVMLGAVVTYLVHRVRVLSRYYEHRPLP